MCRRKVSRSPSTLRNRVVMFYQLFYQFFGVASIALATACGRQADKVVVSDSGGAGAVAPTQAPLVPMRDTVGSGSINWTLVDLEKRMRGAGVEAIAAGEVRQPFLRAPGMSFHLRGGELQAYIYGDAGALSRDTDVLDSVTVSPPTMMIDWKLPPTLIVSNNLALILLTRDPQVRKKVREAVRPDLDRHDQSTQAKKSSGTK